MNLTSMEAEAKFGLRNTKIGQVDLRSIMIGIVRRLFQRDRFLE